MKRHPAYIFLSQEELNYIFFQTSTAGYTGEEPSKAIALYRDGIIFLRSDFQTGVDDDVLLHELVHHLQAEQGRQFPCARAAEGDAYELQAQFIAETTGGRPPDPMWVSIASQCVDF